MSYRMTARDMDAPEPTITGGMPEFAPMGSDWRREPGYLDRIRETEDAAELSWLRNWIDDDPGPLFQIALFVTAAAGIVALLGGGR